MKWKKAKSDLKLEGIKVDYEYTDNQLDVVTLTDVNGNKLKFKRNNTYENLDVCVPSPPEFKTIYRVSGNLNGIKIESKDFDTEHEAIKYCSGDEIKVEKLEILIES